MASGCIMGDCPVCGEFVWEDDWRFFNDLMMHSGCVPAYIKSRHGMSEDQFLRLCGAQELRQEIKDMRQAFNDSMAYYTERLKSLERQLDKIEKSQKGDQNGKEKETRRGSGP